MNNCVLNPSHNHVIGVKNRETMQIALETSQALIIGDNT